MPIESIRSIFVIFITLTFIISTFTFQIGIPKNLWVYWDKPIETAPVFVQICLSKMRSVCEKESWNLVLLNETNLPNYVPNYQTELLHIKKRAAHPDWAATFADLIRLNVLREHGGVWIDISSILFKGLSWLDKLDEVPYLLSNSNIDEGQQPDVILFYNSLYENTGESRDSWGRITNWVPGYEVWFIAAKKNASFLDKWIDKYAKHYQLSEKANTEQQQHKGYFLTVQGDYLNCQKSIYELIIEEQSRLDEHLTLFSQRKNANKQFKILAMKGQSGPATLFTEMNIGMNDLMRLTQKEIQETKFLRINFFIKIIGFHREYFQGKISRLMRISKQFNNSQSKVFEQYLGVGPSKKDCEQVTFITEGSIMGQLIKGNRKADEIGLFTIQTDQRNKWQTYCSKSYNITHDQIKMPDRFKNIMKLIRQTQWISQLLGEETVNQIENLIKSINDIICSDSSILTKYSNNRQAYYWEQVYRIKSQQIKSENENEQTHLQYLLRYNINYLQSQIQLLWLRIKLVLLVDQAYLVDSLLLSFVLVCIFVFSGLCKLGILLTFNLSKLVLKDHVLPIKWLWRLFTGSGQKKTLKQITKKLCKHTLSVQIIINNLNSLASAIKIAHFLVHHLFRFIFGLSFIWYNAFVIHEYQQIMVNAKIYQQQTTLLLILFLQILFRQIGQKIGQQKWVLPGLPFSLIYWTYLPIYYFYFGSSILSLTEFKQHRNFALGFFLCLCIPLLVKLIEHQSRNGLNKMVFKDTGDHRLIKKMYNGLVSVLSNLSSWMQKIIMTFLIMVVLLPNLRFLKHSQQYFLHWLLQNLIHLRYIGFNILIFVYVCKFCQQFLSFLSSVKENHTLTQESSNIKTSSAFEEIAERQHLSMSQSVILINSIPSQKTPTKNLILIVYFITNILGSYVIIQKYLLRGYILYVLLISQSHTYLLRHLIDMSIQETFSENKLMNIYLFVALMMIFVNFYAEICFQCKFHKIIKSQEGIKADQSFKRSEVLISLVQMGIFMYPRVLAINKFYGYFQQIDKGVQINKGQLMNDLLVSIAILTTAILFGQVVFRELIKKLQNSPLKISKPHEESQKNQYRYLEPHQDDQIKELQGIV